MPVLCINRCSCHFNIQLAGQFTMHIWVAFIAGATLAFPYIFYEFWRFIRPALYGMVRHSRGAILAASCCSRWAYSCLFRHCPCRFTSGQLLLSARVENIINFGSYVSTVSSIVLATYFMFELLVFIYFE